MARPCNRGATVWFEEGSEYDWDEKPPQPQLPQQQPLKLQVLAARAIRHPGTPGERPGIWISRRPLLPCPEFMMAATEKCANGSDGERCSSGYDVRTETTLMEIPEKCV